MDVLILNLEFNVGSLYLLTWGVSEYVYYWWRIYEILSRKDCRQSGPKSIFRWLWLRWTQHGTGSGWAKRRRWIIHREGNSGGGGSFCSKNHQGIWRHYYQVQYIWSNGWTLRSCRRWLWLLIGVRMPIYEFRCENCGHIFEKICFSSDKTEIACPQCGSGKTNRQLSVFSSNAVERKAAHSCGSHSGGSWG